MPNAHLLRFSCRRNTVLVTLAGDLEEESREEVDEEVQTILRAVFDPAAAVFVLDLEGKGWLRNPALLMLLGVLWKHVRYGSRKLLISNPTPYELESIKRLRFDRIWSIYHSRDEALAALAADPTMHDSQSLAVTVG